MRWELIDTKASRDQIDELRQPYHHGNSAKNARYEYAIYIADAGINAHWPVVKSRIIAIAQTNGKKKPAPEFSRGISKHALHKRPSIGIPPMRFPRVKRRSE